MAAPVTASDTKYKPGRSMNMYDLMSFDDYEFREFPLAVSLDENGNPTKASHDPKTKKAYPQVIVNSEDELKALLEGTAQVIGDRVRTEDDELDDLRTSAAQAGVKIDKRWGSDRIREEMAKAGKASPVL